MPKYRAHAIAETELYLEFEAKGLEEAWEFARDADGGDFIEHEGPGTGDWRVWEVHEIEDEDK